MSSREENLDALERQFWADAEASGFDESVLSGLVLPAIVTGKQDLLTKLI